MVKTKKVCRPPLAGMTERKKKISPAFFQLRNLEDGKVKRFEANDVTNMSHLSKESFERLLVSQIILQIIPEHSYVTN